MVKGKISKILSEIGTVLDKVDDKEAELLVREILGAKNIVAAGAGRAGMAAKAFIMRLGHMGLKAHMLGDTTLASMGAGDVLLVASGSGETQTVYDLVLIAKKNGARILLVTGNRESRMGKLADQIVLIQAPSKVKPVNNFTSIQPMTTLNEQSLMIFFDALVLALMKEMGETHETMWRRHSNLE
ncbi:MAG: 6-phospho-3-hexuloisomerase [Patescibacteria group bacterium]